MLLSVPFPVRVYAAFRIAQSIKAHNPAIVTVLGGGYVNTELRELAEPRVFDYFDYVCSTMASALLALLEHLAASGSRERLVRTLCARRRAVRYVHWPGARCRSPRGTAHLGRPAAAQLPEPAGHAQPHEPPVERWPLEQADRGPRLLLEKMQLLR